MPQIVEGTVTAAGYTAVANAVTQSQSVPLFAGVRIKDAGGTEIETLTADLNVVANPSGPGQIVNASATFSAVQVTAAVASAELVDPNGTVLVEAPFDPVFPSGEALSITMANLFTEVPD